VKNTVTKIGQMTAHGSLGPTLAIVCPECAREGNFRPQDFDMNLVVPDGVGGRVKTVAVGNRFCPNRACSTHVFVVYEPQGEYKVLRTFPAGRIDFDVTGVPEKVRSAFDEALTCTANECYIGAGMLIRKTLEAVCEDRAAQGSNLKVKINDLKTKVTLPNELFDAMDHLRLLGNDAAHIEAKTYDDVGKEEVLAGIDLTKEIIKSTYQYKGLLGRLQALRKPTT
jgi:hypothetical protein